MEIPEYCSINGCNEEGEKSHLVTRANLPKSEWDNPVFYIYMCRGHHSEEHNIGINTFCMKYGLERELDTARAALASLSSDVS